MKGIPGGPRGPQPVRVQDRFSLELSKLDSWDEVAKAVAVQRGSAEENWDMLRFTTVNFKEEPKPAALKYRRDPPPYSYPHSLAAAARRLAPKSWCQATRRVWQKSFRSN